MSDVPVLDANNADDLRVTPQVVAPAQRQRELEALYRSHFRKVAGYFKRCGQSPAVSHELAQDVFVLALRGLVEFRGQSKLSTWMWTIARNVLLTHVRTPKVNDRDTDDIAEHTDLSDPDDGRLTDECDCVRRAFAAFSKDHAERAQVLYLAVVEGWTREELADFLGRSTHAATEYLSQCKAKLRPYLRDCNEP